jgi:hypothetical protein
MDIAFLNAFLSKSGRRIVAKSLQQLNQFSKPKKMMSRKKFGPVFWGIQDQMDEIYMADVAKNKNIYFEDPVEISTVFYATSGNPLRAYWV